MPTLGEASLRHAARSLLPQSGTLTLKLFILSIKAADLSPLMILGIVGALVSGSLFTLLRTGTLQITAAGAGLIPDILVAVFGATVAIYLWD
ncbi:transglycosylase-associated protein [Nostoc sp. 'Lobaria pulmonaria (5183) cyanobiont']|nr:transglycosylase-associated protein [Nostoc sp. 'Lobaria pulmonaria (5183) cyanobiont']